ncbi:MAG: hypothetical protein SFU27_11760 [Thermonemataceae bacterium]|nr:hypothetical protein [Thermonemataceae bacterium]
MLLVSFNKYKAIYYTLIFAFLLLLRLVFFAEAAPFDYDSVKNYQIIEEIATGDWHNFFHHASPILYLFFLPFYFINASFEFLVSINAFVGVWAVFLWSRLLEKNRIFFVFFLGISFSLISFSLYFSIENLSLLSFAILLIELKKMQKNSNSNNFVKIGIWASITLFINYKAIVPLFFIGLVLIFLGKKNTKFYTHIFIGALGVFLLLTFIGVLAGLAWYQYPAVLFRIFGVAERINPTKYEISYYFAYILKFDVFLIFLSFWGAASIFKRSSLANKIFLVSSIGTFLVMSLLPKAPRGLIFWLPIAYLLTFNWLYQIKYKGLFFIIFVLFSVFQLYNYYQYILPYKHSQYKEAAKYLKEKKVEVVFTTLSINIYPYLSKSIQLVVLREIKDTLLFKDFKGKKYLLYDTYCEISNHTDLKILKPQQADTSFFEKSLLQPMLYLENSEYTGWGFEESLQKQKEIKEQTKHLYLKSLK